MITPEAVKTQLMNVLPQFTSVFSDMLTDITAVVSAGNIITCTKVGHGLSTGDVVSVSESQVAVPITGQAYDSVTKEATLTCDFEHDRTSGTSNKGEYNKAVLTGFDDTTYNNTFVITSATRTTVTFTADAAPIGALGIMTENRSLTLGFAEITKVNEDTFTIPLIDTLLPEGSIFSSISVATASRIIIAADGQRAVNAFGRRADIKASLFVIFGQESASKDRATISDAVLQANAQNDLRVDYIPTVTLMYMESSKKDPLASVIQEKVYSEIRQAIRRSMFGHRFDDPDSAIVFAAIEIANAPEFYNNNDYIHSFVYQIPYVVTLEQGNVNRPNVSLREVIMNSKMFNTEGALLALEAEPEI